MALLKSGTRIYGSATIDSVLNLATAASGDVFLLGASNQRLTINNSGGNITLKCDSTNNLILYNNSNLGITIASSGAVSINSNLSASSQITGSLRVTGGVGISGDVYAANIYTNGTQLTPGGGGVSASESIAYAVALG